MGRSYIDFAGGLGATTRGTGRRPPSRPSTSRWTATSTSASSSACTSRTSTCRRLPSSPCRGEQKTLLVNSGAEALENAVKIRAPTPAARPSSFEHAFHGRTLLTMTMTSKLVYKKGMGPFAPRSTGRRPIRTAASTPRRRSAASKRSSRATSIPSRSPASCSSRYRARAGSSRCRRTILLGYGRCATGTGSSTSTTRCSRASAAPDRSSRSSTWESSLT